MAQTLLSRSLAAALALMVLVSAVFAQGASPLAPPADPASPPTALPPRPLPDPSVAPDITVKFDRAVDLYHGFRDQSPDLAERVLALNLDPKDAFLVVRDQVQSIPYDGHLRDPAAVFDAGGGNAYDKAMALADLLARMGYDAQLVSSSDASPVVTTLPCGSGVVDAARWQATQLGPEVLARIPLRAAASYAMLKGNLAPAIPDQPAATQGHIWVQVRDGANWVDLDPWLATTAYGEHPAGQPSLLLAAPAAHVIRLVLTLETLRDGEVSLRDIMSAEMEVPDVTRSLIALGFGPRVEGVGGVLADALGGLEGQGAQMVANLMINGETRQSDAFTAPSAAEPQLDGFLADGENPGQTTALFLTITSLVPGLADHAETRSILDLVPPELRLIDPVAIDQSRLLPAKMGTRYPAALESLRMIVVSNGASSPRLAAAVSVQQLINLADFLARSNAGLVDGWDILWATWAQTNRIELAAETLFHARPVHQGACPMIDRPRVLISGMASAGGDRVQQWLDWAIDDFGVIGGDAAAQAETRLWHGTLQAALEKEALMQITLSPDDAMPLDQSAALPLPPAVLAALGAEAAQDRARGYLTVADASASSGLWWRVNPQTGAADARALMHGNASILEWGAERAAASSRFGSGVAEITEAEEAYLASRSNAQLLAEINRDLAQAEAAAAKPGCGGNEYLILGTCVSIPMSIAVGVVVTGAIAYALLN